MAQLPEGTVTLLFTDIEGSTRLVQELGRAAYVDALEAHRRLLREVVERHGGVEVEMQGDSFHFAFASARAAAEAAADAQRALAAHDWGAKPVRVRMGLHTGEPAVSGSLYAGEDVHRAARVMDAANGGQVLLSARTTDLLGDGMPEGTGGRQLGRYLLRDFDRPEPLVELVVDGSVHGRRPPRARRVRDGRHRRLAVVVALLLAVAATAGAIGALRGGPGGPTQNVLVAVDADTARVEHRIPVGDAPSAVVANAATAWVLNANDATVSEVDARAYRVRRTIGTTGTPLDIALAGGALWVFDRPTTILRIDPVTGVVLKRITFRVPRTIFAPIGFLRAARGALWATQEDTLLRIDTRTLSRRATPLPDWGPVATGAGSVWISADEAIYRLDGRGRRIVASIPYPASALSFGGGWLWATDQAANGVAQFDPNTNRLVRTVRVGIGPAAIAYGDHALWVATQEGELVEVDPQSGDVLARIRVGGTPNAVTVVGRRVWVAVG